MAGCLRSSRRVRRRRRRRQLDGWVQTLRVYPSRSFSFLHHVVASASFALHSRISRPCRALEPDLRRSFGAVSRSRSTLPSGRFPSAALGGRLAGAVSEPGSSAVEACPNLRERARVSNLEEQRSGRAPTPQFRFAPDVLRRLTVCDSSSARRRSRKSDRSTFARRPSSPADASFPLRCPPDEPNLASPARCSAEAGSELRFSATQRRGGARAPQLAHRSSATDDIIVSLPVPSLPRSPASLPPLPTHAQTRSGQDEHHERLQYVGTVLSSTAEARVEARGSRRRARSAPPSPCYRQLTPLAPLTVANLPRPPPQSDVRRSPRRLFALELTLLVSSPTARVRQHLQGPRLAHGAPVGVLHQRLALLDGRRVRSEQVPSSRRVRSSF